jgi:hypothetical protein
MEGIARRFSAVQYLPHKVVAVAQTRRTGQGAADSGSAIYECNDTGTCAGLYKRISGLRDRSNTIADRRIDSPCRCTYS